MMFEPSQEWRIMRAQSTLITCHSPSRFLRHCVVSGVQNTQLLASKFLKNYAESALVLAGDQRFVRYPPVPDIAPSYEGYQGSL